MKRFFSCTYDMSRMKSPRNQNGNKMLFLFQKIFKTFQFPQGDFYIWHLPVTSTHQRLFTVNIQCLFVQKRTVPRKATVERCAMFRSVISPPTGHSIDP